MASAFVCDEPGKAPASRQCSACSSPIMRAPSARGALPSYCGKPCKRPASPPKTIERQCLDCAAIIVVRISATLRCKPCGQAFGNANAHATRTANALAKHSRICRQCGASFQRMRNSSGNYCSVSCSRAARAEARRIETERAKAERAEAKARAKAEAKAKEKEARQHPPRQCKACSESFIPRHGAALFCSDACSVKTARRASRQYAKAKGIGTKDRKRARYYGVPYEPVSRTKVFERDGWRCQLCGVKTPKAKRGTLEPNAPELDHILPMAKGGEHSYRNTHLACRACNGAKGSRPLGQTRLF